MSRARRQHSAGRRRVRFWLKAIVGLVLVAVCVAGAWWLSRLQSRPSTPVELVTLADGVTYSRLKLLGANQGYWHVVQVDLRSPGIDLWVTAPDRDGPLTHVGMRTTDFVHNFDMIAAVNASFFDPFHSNSPWDYYPKVGNPVGVVGSGISDGQRFSDRHPEWPVFSMGPERAWIRRDGAVAGARCAVAGRPMLIDDGRVVVEAGGGRAPRTAVGLSEDGTRMWLIVVDGRQDGYASGMTLYEFAEQIRSMDVHTALNLDGGGSSTMAARWDGRVQLLNAPFHTRVPMRERPVATHLGVFRRGP